VLAVEDEGGEGSTKSFAGALAESEPVAQGEAASGSGAAARPLAGKAGWRNGEARDLKGTTREEGSAVRGMDKNGLAEARTRARVGAVEMEAEVASTVATVEARGEVLAGCGATGTMGAADLREIGSTVARPVVVMPAEREAAVPNEKYS
jgi:hypothetical protein